MLVSCFFVREKSAEYWNVKIIKYLVVYDFTLDSLSFELPQICDISEKLYYVNSKIPRISIFTKSENLHRKQWNSNFFCCSTFVWSEDKKFNSTQDKIYLTWTRDTSELVLMLLHHRQLSSCWFSVFNYSRTNSVRSNKKKKKKILFFFFSTWELRTHQFTIHNSKKQRKVELNTKPQSCSRWKLPVSSVNCDSSPSCLRMKKYDENERRRHSINHSWMKAVSEEMKDSSGTDVCSVDEKKGAQNLIRKKIASKKLIILWLKIQMRRNMQTLWMHGNEQIWAHKSHTTKLWQISMFTRNWIMMKNREWMT